MFFTHEPTVSRTQRRSDIHRLLKQKKEAPLTVQQKLYWQILNGLNVPTLLETIQRRFPERYLCYGPKAIDGTPPTIHSATVIWYRPPGYYNFKSLFLFGVWAADDPAHIIVGTRILPFSAHFYQPEAYFHRIRKDFTTDYGKNAPPPLPENTLLKTPYDSMQRLALRSQIKTVVEDWYESLK